MTIAPPHTYNTLEICWLTANILFALLSLCFWLPQFRTPFWPRLLWIAFVFGVNVAFDYYDTNVVWLQSHNGIYRPLFECVAFVTIGSWSGIVRWIDRSDKFEREYRWLMWVIIALILLAIPFVLYFELR